MRGEEAVFGRLRSLAGAVAAPASLVPFDGRSDIVLSSLDIILAEFRLTCTLGVGEPSSENPQERHLNRETLLKFWAGWTEDSVGANKVEGKDRNLRLE